MRSTVCFLGLVLLLLIGSPPVGAQESTPVPEAPIDTTDCVDPAFLTNALVDCGADSTAAELEDSGAVSGELGAFSPSSAALAPSEALVFPRYCRLKVDAVFWGGRQPFELAQAIAADYSQCAEYHITVAPGGRRNNNRTVLGHDPMPCKRFDEIRDLNNPRIHPLAEIRWTSPSGWRRWVVGPTHVDGWQPGRTFYGAGVEARRRMVACGLDVTRGETWAFNELIEEVRENAPVLDGPHAGESARVEVLEFMRGLYDGEPGMPKARGIVFNIFVPSDTTDVTSYKADLQAWLEDEAFWRELDIYVDFFAHEVYVSSLNWGVRGAPRARRAEYLNDYFHHVTIIADDGPPSVEAARSFLRRTYVPLANAAWPHPGIGNTDLLSAETMSHFVSTQVYAMRHYSNSHPRTGPRGRIGFGWAPISEFPGYSTAGRDMISARLASAIHEASEQGTNSQMGACGPPGEHVWCGGEVDGAWLNDAWKIFASWN